MFSDIPSSTSDKPGSSVDLSRETSPTEDGVPPAEEATEATEANAGVGDEEDQGADPNQPGIYTEHVFTDPLGVEPNASSQIDTKYFFFFHFYTFFHKSRKMNAL